jgi:hypothetical protein
MGGFADLLVTEQQDQVAIGQGLDLAHLPLIRGGAELELPAARVSL